MGVNEDYLSALNCMKYGKYSCFLVVKSSFMDVITIVSIFLIHKLASKNSLYQALNKKRANFESGLPKNFLKNLFMFFNEPSSTRIAYPR